MMDLQNIAILILVLSNIVFIGLYYKNLLQLKETTEAAVELFFTNHVMQETSDTNQQPEAEDLHKEHFIKFLSDSRDYAFEYIDKVQVALKEFIDIADKEFAYFDAYGILTEQYPNYEAMKTISAEYKKLKNLLPEEPPK